MLITNACLWTAGAPVVTGALRIAGDRIAAVGDIPGPLAGEQVLDAGGRLLTPALIDCHTHLVHAGDRSDEFVRRLSGESYADIARAGGGIMATVRATRAADDASLTALALRRLDRLCADGVGTVEVKSGYGLDPETELRMLRVARSLAARRRVRVVTTHLAAHAVPPEFMGDPEGYLDAVCLPTLRAAQAEGLVDAVDAFGASVAFPPATVARLFAAARALGLPVKLHADQLEDQGGAALAAGAGALSADHLEYASAAGVAAMARAGTVAVLLPGAYYALREATAPPVAAFRAAGVPMAVATDLNPGSSPLQSLLLAMNMACVLFGLTVEEAMAGTTVNAARVLGLRDRGRLAPGLLADLSLWDADSPATLCAGMGALPLSSRIIGGVPC